MLLANLGVIAGIAFLGIEVKQNNDLLAAESSITYMMFRVGVNERWADDAELMDLRIKSSANQDLSPEEDVRLRYDAQSVFAYWAWVFESSQTGRLQELREDTNAWINTMQRYPYFRDAWQNNKSTYPESFVIYMDENVLSKLELPSK